MWAGLFGAVCLTVSGQAPPATSDCSGSVLGRPETANTRVSGDSYPTSRMTRPLTLPGGSNALSAGAIGEVNFDGSARPATESVAFTTGFASGLGCRFELGVRTSVSPSATPVPGIFFDGTVALLPGGLNLAVSVHARVPTIGVYYYGGSVGTPLRYTLVPRLALVGLDYLLAIDGDWFSEPGANPAALGIQLFLPVGILFEATERLSVEVVVRPIVFTGLFAPGVQRVRAFSDVYGEVRLTYAVTRQLDLTYSAYASVGWSGTYAGARFATTWRF